MSFDPITLALAKKYTDEKCGGGGSGAGQKVIDLTQYFFDGNSLNDIVMELFVSGGGNQLVASDAFWADIPSDRPVRFVIDAGFLMDGLKVGCDAGCVSFFDGVAAAITTTFVVSMDGVKRVTLVFDRTVGITVIVEPLTVPGT